MSVIPSVAQLCKFAKLFPCVLSMWYTISLMQIGEIVGAWLSNYRAEKKLTLEQIADASQRYGSGWAASTVSRMEKGSSKGDSLTALIILLATLNDLNHDDLCLSDIFMDCDAVEVGDGFEVDEDGFFNALGGRPVDIADPFEHGRLIPLYATLAETRLANRSGVDSEALHEACMNLYGHSLDEEAAKRAGEGATPQKRGRVTRVLAGEILDYMRKAAAKLED